VKRPPGSPPVFKARYVARGFSQRQGVDYFQTFSPTPKMTTLRVLLHVAAQRDYELHSLDFSTAFLQGSLHEEIWLRRPPGFTGSFPPGTQWSLRRPVYGLRQAPREWHDTLRTTLAALGFAPSTADPSLFLRTDTSLPPFYILVYVDDLVFATANTAGLAHMKAQRTITQTQSHMVQQVLQRFDFTYSSPQTTPLSTRHSLSALPLDESVEPSGPYPELVGCLMYLMTCTRPDLAYPLSILARYVAPGRHRLEHMAAAKRVLRYLCSTSGLGLVLGGRRPVVLAGHADASWADDQVTQLSSQGYTFGLGFGSVSWRSTHSSSVLGSSCEAEIYAGAMAAQELRWLTYLLTDLGEPPRSPPVLYVDNKAMLALCREHRLEHRTKHIALRYFLARELQQRGQLRLAYVASQANSADIFTKALPPGDHQRFCTMLACFALLDWSCDLLFSPTLPMGVDLTRGYYDSGDNVKFGFPLAFTVTALAWSVVEYGPQLTALGQIKAARDAVRWGAHFFVHAHPKPNVLYAQVGDGQSDHSCWQRPEDMTTPRTAYRLDPQHPGTEPAAEAAAALAASSMVFGKTDANYSKSLLTHARQVRCSPMRGRCAAHPCAPGALLTHARQSRLPCSPHPPLPPSCQPSNPWHQLFNFARKYPKKYTDSIPSASAFYNSYSGFNDELLWAAVWLYRATGERRYLDYIVTNEKQLGGTQSSVQNFSWDNKYAGAQVLLAKEYLRQQDPSLELYLKRAKDFVCGTVVRGIRSPGGMLFLMSWSNLQYVTAISMVLSAFADILDAAPASAGNATAIMCDSTPVTPTAMRRFVKRQVDYILGVNPKKVSYMVGFSSSYPQHVHHRGASLPSIWVNNTRMGCNDGWPAFQSKAPNVNVLTGAVIGGPDSSDAFRDERDNYQQVEPSTSINAPFVGVLARVAGGPPKASPPPASPKAPPPPLKAPPPPPGGKRK
ncbi:unnamed protein product, partial [Closterium sp. NIES-53]